MSDALIINPYQEPVIIGNFTWDEKFIYKVIGEDCFANFRPRQGPLNYLVQNYKLNIDEKIAHVLVADSGLKLGFKLNPLATWLYGTNHPIVGSAILLEMT